MPPRPGPAAGGCWPAAGGCAAGGVAGGVAGGAAGTLDGESPEPLDPGDRRAMQATMTEGVGVLRSAESMERAIDELGRLVVGDLPQGRSTGAWEATNLHALSSVLAGHALAREETRGSHWREDFPEVDDARWRVRLVATADPDGVVHTRREPVPAHDYRTPGA